MVKFLYSFNKKWIVLILVIIFVGLFRPWKFTNNKVAKGKVLAEKYCSSCHLHPDPELLPKGIWKSNILPMMANFGNLYIDQKGKYKEMTTKMIEAKDPVAKNMRFEISRDDWESIVEYYLATAPDTFKNRPYLSIDNKVNSFTVKTPVKSDKSFTSSLLIDESRHQLMQASMMAGNIKIYSSNLDHIDKITTTNGVVDICILPTDKSDAKRYLLTHIGSFGPSPYNKQGFVELVSIKGKDKQTKKLVDSLDRPVQSLLIDVNKDGLEDLIVCQFGFLQGELTLFMNTGTGYTKKPLTFLSGATKIYNDDINDDGFPDFWVLFAGGYEGVIQFVNKGNGEFDQNAVLGFPPTFGSTFFELNDFNGDGKKDIIYTCGDNADNSPVPKPYHGIYFFENVDNTFKKTFFLPLDGCYKAKLIDFDKDGDLDVAAIAFFADFENHPDEGFVFFRNDGYHKYTPQTFTGSTKGRWACMDTNDIDGDGDIDIVLGNLAAKPGNNVQLMNEWRSAPEFVVLYNNLK